MLKCDWAALTKLQEAGHSRHSGTVSGGTPQVGGAAGALAAALGGGPHAVGSHVSISIVRDIFMCLINEDRLVCGHLASALCSRCGPHTRVLPFFLEPLLSTSSSPALRAQPPPQVTEEKMKVAVEHFESKFFFFLKGWFVCIKIIRWMARRRGSSGGLVGGLEPLLSKLLRRSCDGDACTVILCWKSLKKNNNKKTGSGFISTIQHSASAQCVWFKFGSNGTKSPQQFIFERYLAVIWLACLRLFWGSIHDSHVYKMSWF